MNNDPFATDAFTAAGRRIAGALQGSADADATTITAMVELPIGIVMIALQALVRAGVVEHDGGTFRWALPASPTVASSPKGRKSRGSAQSPKNSALTVGRCPTCSAKVLTGHHGGWCHSLDADPLTELGEQAALHDGVTTFAVMAADRWKRRSDVWSQRSPFPTGLRPSVHRVHRCEAQPISGDHRRSIPGAADLDKIRLPQADIGEPPF